MATQLQLRKGTTSDNDSFIGAEGELTYDTETKGLRIHDGVTQGGHSVDVVVFFQAPTAENNYTWARKYASGWVEQGGIVNVGGTTGSITLAVEMADTNYQVMAKVANANISSSNTVYDFLTNNYTTTGFGYRGTYNNGSGTGMPGEKFFWEVKGMAA